MTTTRPPRLALVVLTGFLGSGKTTLLKSALVDPAMAGSLVVMNELGDVGLDHHLVEHVTADAVLLKSGCLCCEMRDDLAATLRHLLGRRARAEIRAFDRIIVETTGLAEPEPVMQTALAAPGVATAVELAAVVVTADAILACDTIDRHVEAAKQIAAADRIVVTKTDIAPAEARRDLLRHLYSLNAAAEIRVSRPDTPLDPVTLFGPRTHRTSAPAATAEPSTLGHTHGIVTASIQIDAPLPAAAVDRWLIDLLEAYGPNILRFKGIFSLCEEPRPLVLQAVQHVMHRPELLPSWPSGDRRTRLVVIAHGLDRATLDRDLHELGRHAVGSEQRPRVTPAVEVHRQSGSP